MATLLMQNWNWEIVENMLYNSASKLFTADCLLTDSHGEPFSLSTVAPDTVLLLLYHYPCRPNISVNYLYMWKLLEEVVKHDHQLPFKMIYVGKCSEELSKGLAERIMAYASVDSDAHLFLKKAFNVKVASSIDCPEFVVTEVVADEEGRKHFSTWKNIKNSFVDFLLSKSRLYSGLQKLTEAPQENVKLLSALFDTAESTSSTFVRSYTENIGVDQLHGKRVLLFISIMDKHHVMDAEQLFYSLTEIYLKAKSNDDMEILSIPIPAEVRGEEPRQDDLDEFESTLRKVPWPVLRNPWSLKTEVYYFFEREWSELNPAILVVVEPNGRISNENALPLVKKWGAEVYPFSEEKIEQLEQQTPPRLREEESVAEPSDEIQGLTPDNTDSVTRVIAPPHPSGRIGWVLLGVLSTTDSFTLMPPILYEDSSSPHPSYSLPVTLFVSTGGEGRMRVDAPVDLRGTSGTGIMVPMWSGCDFELEDLFTQTGTIFLPRLPRYF